MSTVSIATTYVKGGEGGSDSNSASSGRNACHKKRARRHDQTSDYSSRFKGVVALQNGHWGAQIYANHQRIWLGTFKSEDEAARAYDSAAITIRNWDSHRNFPWTSVTSQEPKFQSQYDTEAILCMIKDGSYPSKFAEYLKMQYPSRELDVGLNLSLVHWKGDYLCTLLFEKTLTPSDVSKLNRLVIPKKHAVSYFPFIDSKGVVGNKESGGEEEDVQLVLYDRALRPWSFRYCYWKSSQSFVFTRGWNEFVREKKLKGKDRVIFSKCEYIDASDTLVKFCMIDLAYYDDGLVENVIFPMKEITLEEEVQRNNMADKDLENVETYDAPKKGFKLFGVEIC